MSDDKTTTLEKSSNRQTCHAAVSDSRQWHLYLACGWKQCARTSTL